ncbi:hypothetical protein ACA910_022386 [Epithemia clementina (nom. ined.)]
MLKVVALRDIAVGNEVTVDYGCDWELAWQQHLATQFLPEPNSVQQANAHGAIQWLQSYDLQKMTMDLDEC